MYKVLFLEDEVSLVQDLPPALRDKGIELVATTSIDNALRWISEQYFDAVLLDIQMPPGNIDPKIVQYGRETGIEVARSIVKEKPALPIVALTVVRDLEIQKRMREAGIVDIVNKPSDSELIAEILLRTISKRRSHDRIADSIVS
jgi:CheY-like chemotaxis protein